MDLADLVPADDAASSPRSLSIEHLSVLANLPLDAEEREALAEACRDVLEAFELPEQGDEPLELEPGRLFDDEVDAWPEAGVEDILAEVPELDGRDVRV